MAKAGLRGLHDMSQKSLMWLHALTELSTFLRMKKDCIHFLRQERPCAVILIDYCGFNFYLARAAKKTRYPRDLLYQPTALGTCTLACKKDEKLVDKLLVIYPFEKSFYDNAAVSLSRM